jgi:hypothetical protein
LKKTIALNDIEHIVVAKNMAIADYKGTYGISDCLSIMKTADGTFTKPRKIMVNCNTLDSEMDKKSVDLLCIDIPESEFAILNGSSYLIDRSPDIIIVMSFDNDPPSQSARKVLKNLEKKNFKFYIGDKKCNFKLSNIEEVLKEKEMILIITRKHL